MKIGIIISTNDAETCWNALRFANVALAQKDQVSVFFIGKGVEYLEIGTKDFNVIEQAENFMRSGGKVDACGTCIKFRHNKESEMCPISTMKDLYDIVQESDKILTF